MSSMPAIQPTDWREERRMQAWALHQLGWSQYRIAAALGVSQSAVSQWLTSARDSGGVSALRRHQATGRKAFLTNEQFAQLPLSLARGAESFGFADNKWTTWRVAIVIQQRFGVSYHPGHVSRILKQYCPGWQNREKE
jgi:transposase